MKLELLHKILLAAVLAAAANVIFLMAHGGSYDLGIGILHSRNAFKPLLILNGVFLISVLAARPHSQAVSNSRSALTALLIAVALGSLAWSFTVNPLDDEWNYRGYSATHDSLSGLLHLFASSQIGVWYRPVGFVSLWADYALFHQHVWAYHFQNVLLHLANCFLVFLLSRRLGLTQTAARWSGVLYLTAAITYEPVMWPSARFDLWAMLFTLAASLAAIRFLIGDGRVTLAAGLACYALAVASKESGYAFPILLAVLAASWPFTITPPDKKRRLIELAIGVVLVTGVMLAIREAVLGGTGGYPGTSATPSPHLSFSVATLRIVLTRAMPWSMLAVNLNYPTPAVVLAVLAAFAAVIATAALAGASATRRHWLLIACVFAAAVPVAPIISWLDFNAQHVRYLYMPAAFVMMFAAVALANARRAELFLFAFGALNLACGFYNTTVYRNTYIRSRGFAEAIGSELKSQPPPPRIEILGMPEEYNGVLFSRFELEYRLEELVPGVKIKFEQKGACSAAFCYAWDPAQRSLGRIP